MRTTIDIPEVLLSEVIKITGAETKRKAVILALENLVAAAKRKRLITMKGYIDLDIDLETLRKRK